MSKSTNDHQRVLEILHKVDLTAEQRLVNQELRDAVLDAEDAVCMLEQQLRIHQLNNDCVAAIQVAQERLARFENEISYAHSTTRQEDEQYARECSLLVDGKRFQTEEMRLTSLRGIDTARDRLAKIQTRSELSMLFKEGAGAVLDQAEQVAIENKLDTSPWAGVLGSALQAVADMVRENSGALDPLKSLDDSIAELKSEAQKEVTLQQAAIEAGDVASSEEHVKTRMVLLEGISGLIQRKFKILGQIEGGPLVKAQREAQQAREHLSKAAIEIFERHDSYLQNLESDGDRLDQYRSRAKQKEDEARALFFEQKVRSDKYLSENLEKQRHCWKELLRIEAQLSALAEERREEVERRVRGFEREERRRCDMGHFASFADSRQKQLSRAIDSIITEKRVGAALADIVNKAVYTLSEEVNVMQNEVKETKKKMLEEHAGHFREQYLTVGELLFRKERLVEECDKKMVELRMQQEIAMDTLDPKARIISEQRIAIEQQRDEVASFIELLQNKTEMYINAFRPSDAAIRSTTGIATSFNATEAMEELRKQNETRSRALDQYFIHMTVEASKAEEALGRPKPNGELRVHPKYIASQSEVSHEWAEIEAMRDFTARNLRKSIQTLSNSENADVRMRARQFLEKRPPALANGSSPNQQQQQQQNSRPLLIRGSEDPPDSIISSPKNSSLSISRKNQSPATNNNNHKNRLILSPNKFGHHGMTGLDSSPQLGKITRLNNNNNQNQQQDDLGINTPNNNNNNNNSIANKFKSTIAERLSAALRASALGLDPDFEPNDLKPGQMRKPLKAFDRVYGENAITDRSTTSRTRNRSKKFNNTRKTSFIVGDDDENVLMPSSSAGRKHHTEVLFSRIVQVDDEEGFENDDDDLDEKVPKRFKGIQVEDPSVLDDLKVAGKFIVVNEKQEKLLEDYLKNKYSDDHNNRHLFVTRKK